MTNSLIPLLVIHHSFTLLRKVLIYAQTYINITYINKIADFDHLFGMSQLVIATPNQQIHLYQKELRETTLFSKPPHSWGTHSLLAIAVWHGPVKSGVIDAAVTLGDTSLTEKGHLMEEIIDSICIHSHSARSLISIIV